MDEVKTVNAPNASELDAKINKLIAGRRVKGNIQYSQLRAGEGLSFYATIRMEQQSKRQHLVEG